jgi:hypothetical protein
MTDFSYVLFARPSFIEGMARVLDIGGTLQEYNTSPSGREADALAFRADMKALRHDFSIALDEVSQSIATHQRGR